jgi:hypothetical protein
MIIVIDLMRNIFVLMFFVLMGLEIIVLVSLATLYNGPLKSNQESVETSSLSNTKEVLTSFNNILTRKLYNLETDLIMIAKHVYPMYLSQNKLDASYPSYNPSSSFYKSFKNCMISYQDFLNNPFVTKYNRTDFTKYGLIDSILLKNKNFSQMNEDEIINQMFEEERLNYITYYPNISPNDNDVLNIIQPYVCHTVSILKTLTIRNLIFEKSSRITSKYYLFLANKYVYQYPIDFFNNKINVDFSYFSSDCNSYTENSCIDSLKNFNKLNTNNDIYFDKPLVKNDQIISRGCIKIKFNGNTYSDTLKDDYACLDFSIKNILNKIVTGKNHSMVNLFIVSEIEDVEDDLNLHYTNVFDLTNFNKSIFSNSEVEDKYKGSNANLSLFHGLYYEIINNIIVTTPNNNLFLGAQYKNLASELTKIIKYLKTKEKQCDSYKDILYNVTTEHSFFKEKIDVTGSLKSK